MVKKKKSVEIVGKEFVKSAKIENKDNVVFVKEKPLKRPPVLAYRRHLFPTTGLLMQTTFKNRADKRKWKCIPVQEINDSQQEIQFCQLAGKQDTIVLEYGVSFDGNVGVPEMTGHKFAKKSRRIINALRDRYSVRELALRYAANIAYGRVLLRNKLKALRVETVVMDAFNDTVEPLVFYGFKHKFNRFDDTDIKINALADRIESALLSDGDFVAFRIITYARVGLLKSFYPLQKHAGKLVALKLKNEMTAGFHVQDVAESLRTVDTWFLRPGIRNISPVPIEPFDSMPFEKMIYRNRNNKNDFYSLFSKMMKTEDLTAEEFYYVYACLIHGVTM